MLADDLSLHGLRIDIELLCEMESKAQGVEKRAAAQHAVVPADASCNISQRIGGSVITGRSASGAAATIRGTTSR